MATEDFWNMVVNLQRCDSKAKKDPLPLSQVSFNLGHDCMDSFLMTLDPCHEHVGQHHLLDVSYVLGCFSNASLVFYNILFNFDTCGWSYVLYLERFFHIHYTW